MTELNMLTDAVKALIGEAQSAFVASDDKQDIKRACDKLRLLLREWNARDKMVRQTISGLIDLVSQNCDHAGAERGYNERDGSWMNPCPTCGWSQ